MARYPKFMIAKNQMAKPEGIYIYHSRTPRFLAKVDGNIIEIVDDIDSMIDYYKGDVSKVEGLFNRMKDWYKSFEKYNNENRQVHGKN